ncbi:FAD-dependent thymidylate synthase [Roseofilum casamattae]|uniref:FAD-dependent thymidylate synthase n=1 Tax=Roseofilum casamattae BLCC-M143 TaxID=3022442 RepID=A0ABT7C0D2_9CYAN|nr:FAD-dependent thymidylate synthase [Roseofilum casamattae]MDJ1184902.1 FAD-dependent thymidylate synthase [Roseofilum casamattae BLCC-M143]
MDKFRVEVISQTSNPQQVIYAAMHQDYSENLVYDERDNWPEETEAGNIIVKRLLAGGRGHYGPLEHPQIVLNCGYFPHSVMQQVRTHRVGISFDVQCLAANTEVTFVNCNGESSKKLKKTIGELYDLWHNGEKGIRSRQIRGRKGEPPGEYRRDCQQRLRKMRLRVLNEETGLFEIGHIKQVICQGIQPVYRITLENGKTLDCTVNHRLFTSAGWQTMGEAVGLVTRDDGQVLKMTKEARVMCNGIPVTANRLYREKHWMEEQVSAGYSIEKIAELANCSASTIRHWANQHGLPLDSLVRNTTPPTSKLNPLYRDQLWLQEKLGEGLHVDEMAELCNCSIEVIKKWVYFYGLSLNKRPKGSKEPWNKGKPGYHLNLSPESQQKRRDNARKYTRRGADSNFWKGGTSNERQKIGAWTREIAPQVHQKFDYICQCCGERGGQLHAHHLVPVYADESLAYDFDNLITLCKTCHESIHQNHQEEEFAKSYQPILEPKSWNAKPKPPGNKLKAHPVKVVKVEYLGHQMTYDLEVSGKWHNFVANNLVVHNSNRYTGSRIVQAARGLKDIEEVFYLRPVGDYSNRQGKHYTYTEEMRNADLEWCLQGAKRYAEMIENGVSEEHARGIIAFDVRQHFVVSLNARSLMHLLDLRYKLDAQLECQKLCEHIFPHFERWIPEIAQWYSENRLKKARLSP